MRRVDCSALDIGPIGTKIRSCWAFGLTLCGVRLGTGGGPVEVELLCGSRFGVGVDVRTS